MFLVLLLLVFVERGISDPVSVVTFGICESTFEFHTNFGCDVGIGFDYASFSCGWCIEHIEDVWLNWFKRYLTSGNLSWVRYVWDVLKSRSSFSCGLFVGIDIGWGFGVSCGYLSAGCAVSTFRVGISCGDEDDDEYGEPLHEICELPILRNYVTYQTADYLVHLKETGVYPNLDVASALQNALDHLDANYEYFYSAQDRDSQLIDEAIEFSHTTGCPDIKSGRNIASLWTHLGETCHGMSLDDLHLLLDEVFPVAGSLFEEDITCRDNDWTCGDHEAFELMDNIVVSQKCAMRFGMSDIEARIQEFLEFLGEQSAYEFVPPFVDHFGVDLPSKALAIKSHYLPCVGMDLERVRADITSFVNECYGPDMVDQALDILYWEEDPEVMFEEMKKALDRTHGHGVFQRKLKL